MAHVFVDVSNAASLRDGQPGHEPWSDVVRICSAWLELHPNDSMVLVVDWGFYGFLEYRFPAQLAAYVRAKEAGKLKIAGTSRFAALIEVPEGVAADEYVLQRADRYADRQIIAEDHYRGYRTRYPWLQGFELQLPVFQAEQVGFRSLYLAPLSSEDIEAAQITDELKLAELSKTRDARRNRHQRRRAARSTPKTASRRTTARPSPAKNPERVRIVGDQRGSAEPRPAAGPRRSIRSGRLAAAVLTLAACAALIVVLKLI